MKLRLLITALLLGFGIATLSAQDLKTIKEIQTSVSFEADSSVLKGQRVRVRGVVGTDPNLWYQVVNTNPAYSFWIVEKGQSGPQTGLSIRLGNGKAADATGVKALRKGQEVELVGVVDYYNGETQLNLDEKEKIKVIAVNVPIPDPIPLEVGVFNDETRNAKPTGEPYQGCFVALQNVRVIDVSNQPDRGSFTVIDAEGNKIDVFDANLDMRQSKNGFIKPAIGVVYTNVKGYIIHRKFPNPTPQNPWEYEICPFDTAGAIVDPKTVPPSVVSSQILRVPVCPKPTENVRVNAPVTHPSGSEISKVTLHYAVGSSNLNYIQVEMVKGGTGSYSAEIPAQPVGSFVHYYVEAVDVNGNKTIAPFSSRSNKPFPYSYVVSDQGCRIRDIQQTFPVFHERSDYYESGYRNHTVTNIKGVVTASTKSSNLGFCYIQDRNFSTWSGINLVGDIANLNVGDSVEIESAIVDEYFGMTYLKEANTIKVIGQVRPIAPIDLDVDRFNPDSTNIFTETYEGMLVRFERGSGGIKVVNSKKDNCSTSFNTCMDWVIGSDPLEPTKGVRVLTGGPSGAWSSKAVSYINDSIWKANLNSGVEPKIIDNKWSFDAVMGILVYSRNRIRVTPRNNEDFIAPVNRMDEAEAIKAVVYPNPANDAFTILTQEDISQVQLFDVTGRIIIDQQVNGAETTVFTQNCPSGVYLIKIIGSDRFKSGISRIIINK
jgi:hypothetical protein